ncbi:uncharacterized protein VDAG_05620 [Verticillium dahliae VdLs.17]|uniref:Uncharacterized protein n=1 Tax=Verticillium dahliae (strain VdLs.17 / ATCC MYA-4575 / FGSC 10137) TaxID=498257 RepID=G2X5W5_VERDV|nr:uncharacterized protein VDAG_05620 [Verticillium dahliae VdLs.17]EGY14456.1 hypothetical protein VDAG_05620 [Verticillium dahliae VdLs.17]
MRLLRLKTLPSFAASSSSGLLYLFSRALGANSSCHLSNLGSYKVNRRLCTTRRLSASAPLGCCTINGEGELISWEYGVSLCSRGLVACERMVCELV